MFTAFRQEDPDLTEAIARAYRDLQEHQADSKEYAAAVDQLVKLQSFKMKALDPNTVLTVAGNLAIGMAVLKHESIGVVTSKVWNFLQKI